MAGSSWKALMEAARAACPVGLWTRGQTLARDGAVLGESREIDDYAFRVRVPGRPVPPTVHLYPADGDRDCDCDGNFDACEHVAACLAAVAVAPEAVERLFERKGPAA